MDDEDNEEFSLSGIAGLIAESTIYPIDTVNTRAKMQLSKIRESTLRILMRMYKTGIYFLDIDVIEGMKCFFYGYSALPICSLPQYALYFGVYETLKSIGLKFFPGNKKITYFTCGTLAELIIAFYTVPFEVVKKRMQMGKIRSFEDGWLHTQPMYKNGPHALYTIFKYEGFKGLYSGFQCCILSETIFSAFQFLFYESFKNKYMSYTRRKVTGTSTLLMGGVAGALGSVISNPFDTASARLMTMSSTYHSVYGTFKMMIKKEGFMSLFSGTLPRALSYFPLSGLTFFAYEEINRLIDKFTKINSK